MSIESPFRGCETRRVGRGSPRYRLASAGILLVGILLVAAGCRSEPEGEPPLPLGEPEYEGLSREEIELQAEPMTPAEAERLGIVDTTIRMEAPIHPDSVVHLEGGEVPPVDTAPRQ